MCGRLAQHRAAEKYLASLGSQAPCSGVRSQRTSPNTMSRRTRAWTCSGRSATVWYGARNVRTGRPAGPRHPCAATSSATREKVAISAYFRQIWPNRALFCTDGWYEWCSIEGQKTKQAYYIHRRDTEPLFTAANSQFPAAGSESRADDGFRIITADSQGGMLDVHDRRPVVLDALRARLWLSDIGAGVADELLQARAVAVDAFVWHPVGRDVGNPRNEGPHLIEAIA